MASACPGGTLGVLCKAVENIKLPEGSISVGQISHAAGGTASTAAGAVAGGVLSQIAQAMASAADGLLKTLSTFWMNVDTPQLNVSGSPVAAIKSDTSWIVTVTAIVCILVAAARMAIRRRGEPAATMLLGLARLVIVSAAAGVIVEAAGKLGDLFSASLMSSAHLGTQGWSGIISTTAISTAVSPGDGMLLIIALLIIFSSLIQLMLMILRVGLLVILTGTLPLAAAASMSEWGETWWRKHVAWLTAWLLYKPAAALLYAAAFALTDGRRTAVEVMSGFMLLILSVLILPALLKVIVPVTASLGAASGGALAMGAAGAMATGAIKVAAIGGAGPAGAAAAAPSGSPAPARGGSKTGGPDGAGLSTQGPGPRQSAADFSERALAQPSGKQPVPRDGGDNAGWRHPAGSNSPQSPAGTAGPQSPAGTVGSQPPASNETTGAPLADSSTPPADGPATDTKTQPPSAPSPERNEVTRAAGPSGATGHGDDDEPENGG